MTYWAMCQLDVRKRSYRAYEPASTGDIEVDTMDAENCESGEGSTLIKQAQPTEILDMGKNYSTVDLEITDDSADGDNFRDAEVEEVEEP